MAICNLFNEFTNYSGNFLMFSQYVEDITQNFTKNDSNYRVIPSRFVALDIDYLNLDDSVFGLGEDPTITDDLLNKGIPKYFQNYFENGCAYGRSPEREIEDGNWKWTPEKSKNLFWNAMWDGGFLTSYSTDPDRPEEIINEVVYYGDINMHSYNEHKGMGYGEIYCYIPTDGTQKYCQVIKRENRESLLNSKNGVENDRIEGHDNLINNLSKRYYYNSDFLMSFNINSGVLDTNKTLTHKYNVNTIVVLYDIYEKLNEDWISVYSDIPLGLYIAGKFVDGKLSNSISKYVTTSYGTGTSYGLRICTRFSVSPNGTILNTHDISVDENYVNYCQLMVGMNENLSKMMHIVKSSNDTTQQYKDFLSIIKNNRTNVPYVKHINGEDCWFVNGRFVSKVGADMNDCVTLTSNEIKNHINGIPNNTICGCDEATPEELANALGIILDNTPINPPTPPSCSCEEPEFASDNDIVDYLRNTSISTMKINPSIKTLFVGEEFKLNALFNDIDVSENCRWRSDTTYVTVDNNGKISGDSIGNAIITAYYDTEECCENRTYLGKCKVFVIDNGEIANMRIEANKSNIDINETLPVRAMFYTTLNGKTTNTYDVTNDCTWETSNGNVANVVNGNIVGVSEGIAMICAKYDNEITSFIVTVNPEDAISLNKNALNYTEESYDQYVIVNASKTYTVSNTADWITINQSVNIVNVSVSKNTSEKTRTAIIKFYCGSASTELRVNQKGKEIVVPPVVKKLERISLNNKSITGNENTSANVRITAYYSDGSNTNVTNDTSGYSENANVAIYNAGIISLKKAGTTTITISYTDNGITVSESLKVTVIEETKPTYTYELSPKNSTIYVGETVDVTFKMFEVLNGKRTDVTNGIPSYTILSGSGVVEMITNTNSVTFKGISDGTAMIQCYYNDKYLGSDSIVADTIEIKVTTKDVITYELVLDRSSVSLKEGTSVQLNATYYTYTNDKVTNKIDVNNECDWQSSNTDIVSVTSGNASAISVGNATVTATYNNYSASCEFTVDKETVITHEIDILKDGEVVGGIILKDGDEFQLQVKYYKLTDGIRDNGTDVTSDCTWHPANKVIESLGEPGKYKATYISPGTSELGVEYVYDGTNKISKNCSIKVKKEPVITMKIANLQSLITNVYGEYGYNGKIIMANYDGKLNTDLEYDLYYNNGNISDTVTGTLKQWLAFYDMYKGTPVFLITEDNTTFISKEFTDSQWTSLISQYIDYAIQKETDQQFNITLNAVELPKDPIITMTIDNLKDIVLNESTSELGIDNNIYIVDVDNNIVANYLFVEKGALYYFDNVLSNIISAKTSEWKQFYNDYSNSSLYLGLLDAQNDIIRITSPFNGSIIGKENDNFNKINNAITTAETTGEDQSINITWPYIIKTKEEITYELEISPKNDITNISGQGMLIGESLQLSAILHKLINGVRESYTDVTSRAGTKWLLYDQKGNLINNSLDTAAVNVLVGLVTAKAVGSVTVKAEYRSNTSNGFIVNVSVPQSLAIDKTTLSVSSAGEECSVGVSGSNTFTVEKNKEFISLGVAGNQGSYDAKTGIYTSDSNTETFKFKVESNIDSNARTGKLIFKCDGLEKTLSISQSGNKTVKSITITINDNNSQNSDGVNVFNSSKIGEKYKLQVNASYSDGSFGIVTGNVKFESDKDVVIFGIGTITLNKLGLAKITATYTENGVTCTDTSTIQVGSIQYNLNPTFFPKTLTTNKSFTLSNVYLQIKDEAGNPLNYSNGLQLGLGDDVTQYCSFDWKTEDGNKTVLIIESTTNKPPFTVKAAMAGNASLTINCNYNGVDINQTFDITVSNS